MNNKRILLTAVHPVGGIKTFFKYIYAAKAFSDFDLTFVTPDANFTEFANEFIPNADVKTISASGKGFISDVRALIKEGDFQLVHSHGFTAGIYTQLSCTGISIPHVMTAHDVFTERQFAGVKGRVKKWLMARLFGQIDIIHTVTKAAEKNFLQYFPNIRPEKINCIVHGVDAEAFANAEQRALKQELELNDDAVLFGFFGRFMAQKAFRVIVDAVGILKQNGIDESQVRVCTFGWGGFIREDYQYIEDKGVRAYFEQLPATNDMPASIKGVDCVLMPSRWEACGLLAMESLSAATPIISTNCVGLDEVTESTPALVIDINDHKAMAEQMTFVLNNSAKVKQDFIAYQKEAVSRFSISRPINELVDLYQSILGGK